MLYHLKPTGRAGIVLANGSMSSSQNSEGEIRRAMVDADVVEVMIALPGQLFFNTQIPACLWFLTKQKSNRKGEVLFIDARKLGTMISRVQTEFADEVIERIAGTVAAWRGDVPPLPVGEGRGIRPTGICIKGDVLPLPVGEGRGEGESKVEGESKEKSSYKLPLPEDLLEFARQLRQHSTDAEQRLWFMLRDRRMADAKFRRQHPVHPYILDFYCHGLKLAIELDGGQHNTDEGRAHDERRSRFLADQGIQVLRFWNNDVLQQPESVLQVIFNAVKGNSPSPQPSPSGRGSVDAEPFPSPSGRGARGEGENRGEGIPYADIPGYCRSVTLAEIAEHGHVLTPGRYVGAEAVENDDVAFADKMQALTEKLGEQMAKGAELDQLIRQKLGGLGYDF